MLPRSAAAAGPCLADARLAVGEQREQLLARHAGPGAHGPDVEMDEGIDGTRIKADAAVSQPHRGRAHPRYVNAGQKRSIALPAMCWLYFDTPFDRRGGLPLVSGAR